jgi:D-aspartate ligase
LSEPGFIKISDAPDRPASAVAIGGELNGLGVCRTLALGGAPVWVLDCRRSNPAIWLRRTRSILVDSLRGEGFVDLLRDLGRRFAEPPCLVVTDKLALLLRNRPNAISFDADNRHIGSLRFHLEHPTCE